MPLSQHFSIYNDMGYSLELNNITFSYSMVTFLTGVSLCVQPGEVIGITAKAGDGKTTLLKICAGLIEPQQGVLLIDRKHFWQLSMKEQYRLRGELGFLFQEGGLIANMTIFKNLALPLQYHALFSEKEIATMIDQWLSKMKLMPYRDLRPAALSSGLRRAAGFIRTMMHEAKLFFWDEPTEGVSQELIAQIGEAIEHAKKRGVASILTTQDEAFLRQYTDRTLTLVDGKLEER